MNSLYLLYYTFINILYLIEGPLLIYICKKTENRNITKY